jgi:hypothetical protein
MEITALVPFSTDTGHSTYWGILSASIALTAFFTYLVWPENDIAY